MHNCEYQYIKFRKVNLHGSKVFRGLTACLLKNLTPVTLLLTMCHYFLGGGFVTIAIAQQTVLL